MNQFLSTPQAATMLAVSESTLQRYRITNEGPPYIKVGNRVRYDIKDLEDWVESKKIKPSN